MSKHHVPISREKLASHITVRQTKAYSSIYGEDYARYSVHYRNVFVAEIIESRNHLQVVRTHLSDYDRHSRALILDVALSTVRAIISLTGATT